MSILAFLTSLMGYQNPDLRFVEPTEAVFAGSITLRLDATFDEEDFIGLELFVNGRSVSYFDEPPFVTDIDFSNFPEGPIRVEAVLSLFPRHEFRAVLEGHNYPHFEKQRVNLVRVPVLVEGGAPEETFQAEDFTLLEDGRPQTIDKLFDHRKPMHLVVLIDLSGSMERHVYMLRRGLLTLVDSLRPGDSIHLIGFNHEVFEICPPETDMGQVRKKLHMVREVAGATNLYGAVWSGVKSTAQTNQRRAVILFTDGYHDLDGMEDPYKKNLEDCVALARDSGIPLFTMGLGAGIKPELLKELARATGGRSFILRNTKSVAEAFGEIGVKLGRQYLLCYYTRSPKGGWHDIEVQLNRHQGSLRYPSKLFFRRNGR